MLSWFRVWSPSSRKQKVLGKRGRRGSSRRLSRDRPTGNIERLEDRSLLAADLTLNLSVNPPPSQEIAPGEQLVYTIQAGNGASGTTNATGVMVTDFLGLVHVQSVQVTGAGATWSQSGSTISANLGTLAPRQTDTITIVATVSANSGSVSNTASMNNSSGDTNPPSQTVTNHLGFGAVPAGAFLQGTPGDGTVPTGITNLYEELLGRQPDQGGFQAWVAFAEAHANALGDQAVVSGFMNSPEYKEHYVNSVYQVFLGRPAEPAALAFWTNKMGNPGSPGGHTGSADEKYVLAAILGSDEFYQDAGGTPQAWINALYEDLLGRAAEGGGLTFWQNELAVRDAGDRDGVVRDFLTSPEAVHDLLDAYYPLAGGSAAAPLPQPGAPAGLNKTKLAELTGGGWENLYFEGAVGSSRQADDGYFSELAGGASWDDVQYQMLTSQQFYTNPNRPVTSGATDS